MKLLLPLALAASTYAETNWQQVGMCGVPVTRPNEDIFTYAGRSLNRPSNSQNGMGKSVESARAPFGFNDQFNFNENTEVKGEICDEDIKAARSAGKKSKMANKSNAEVAKLMRQRARKKHLKAIKSNPPINMAQTITGEIKSPTKEVEKCKSNTRIVGGKEAVEHSWPWQIYISICGLWFGSFECNVCGGVLISPDYVLSAAHCVPESVRGWILVGAHSLIGRETQHGRYVIKSFEKHKHWNYPGIFDNDIALLQPSQSIYMFQKVIPICLPPANLCMKAKTQCVVTGWGLTGERGAFPDKLQEVAVELIDRAQCKRYGGYTKITEHMMCAGYPGGGKDACGGDSGGPLVCRLEEPAGAWVLYGLVSWGYGCARPNNPGVYTNVKGYLDWIKEKTNLYPDAALDKEEACHGNIENEGEKAANFVKQTYAQLLESAAPVAEPPSTCDYDVTGPKLVNNDNYDSIENRVIKSEYDTTTYGWPLSQCRWTIKNTNDDYYIEVIVKRIHLMDRLCHGYKPTQRRYLVITYVDPYGTKRFRKLCAIRSRVKVLSRTMIDIRFNQPAVSGSPSLKLGFELEYTFKNAKHMCNTPGVLTLNNNPYQIVSQNMGIKAYDSSSQCRWAIHADNIIKMNIISFMGERQGKGYNIRCDDENDNLMVYHAKDCSDETLMDSSKAKFYGTVCGMKRNMVIYIEPFKGETSTDICLVFLADSDTSVGVGFKMEVSNVLEKPVEKVEATTTSTGPKKKKKKKNKNKKKRGKSNTDTVYDMSSEEYYGY